MDLVMGIMSHVRVMLVMSKNTSSAMLHSESPSVPRIHRIETSRELRTAEYPHRKGSIPTTLAAVAFIHSSSRCRN
ncbi:hypothetical protein RvY_07781 [Ramazzottius varieornatus]|uniref:Uncharacterized protein n=1 Tax=Ramazzottius varieornatus TaxID=947166 RepID=A0A1D1V3G7_RAMVA|nr:hypothetical protein RvY_07781 [Ramazzottius varieornatus]